MDGMAYFLIYGPSSTPFAFGSGYFFPPLAMLYETADTQRKNARYQRNAILVWEGVWEILETPDEKTTAVAVVMLLSDQSVVCSIYVTF